MFPDSFTTARLRAERLTADHFPDLIRMHADPEQMAMLGGVRDEAQTSAYLARNLQHWLDHGFGLWILRDGMDHRIVGRGLLRHLQVDDRDEVEVGYGFYAEYWGRGLATEIASACLQLGRDQLGLQSVVALTTPANLQSQRVMTKIGMVLEREIDHEGVPHLLFRSHSSGAASA